MIRRIVPLLAICLAMPSLAGDGQPKASLGTSPTEEQAACQARLREYRQSIECFAPYRTVKGGVRPEAFQHCKEVPQPRGCHYVETSAPPTRYLERATDRSYSK